MGFWEEFFEFGVVYIVGLLIVAAALYIPTAILLGIVDIFY